MLFFKVIFKIRKSEKTRGISSICEDLTHILFLDYDNIDKKIVMKELRQLQHDYLLTPFYLFTTKEKNGIGNYHAICLTKLNPSEVIHIQQQSHCDSNYITMPIRNKYRTWVLRCFSKGKRESPKYIGLVGDIDYLDNEISEAHLNFLRTVYNVDKVPYEDLDGLRTIQGEEYKTLNV